MAKEARKLGSLENHEYGAGRMGRALRTYVAFKIANLVLAIGGQILVVKILVPEQYATYAVLLAVMIAGERLLSFGVDRTIMRFVPALTAQADSAGLRSLFLRVASVRAVGVLVLTLAFVLGASLLGSQLPTPLNFATTVAFYIWFLSYMLMADADAFAQSWLAHFDSALASFIEVALRTALIVAAIFMGVHVDGATVVYISCFTMTSTVIGLVLSLSRFKRLFRSTPASEQLAAARRKPTFEPRQALSFALANYASTAVYLISSPPVIRIVSATGLSTVALAAFSFIQTLATSLQRIFPGQLVLPLLEPAYMSRTIYRSGHTHGLAALSLVFKCELIILMLGVIFTAIAGGVIVEILSRFEYAKYYYVLPVLLIYIALATSYRLLEIVINSNFKQRIFFFIWPIGLVGLFFMHLTVGDWGLASVLFFPTAEIFFRVLGLAIAFRRYGTYRIFDFTRSGTAVGLAFAITFLALGAIQLSGADCVLCRASVATIGAVAYIGGCMLAKPLRTEECMALERALPRWLGFLLPVARLFSRG